MAGFLFSEMAVLFQIDNLSRNTRILIHCISAKNYSQELAVLFVG